MIPLVRSSFVQWFWRRFADCSVGIFGGRSGGRFLGGFSGGVWKFIFWKVCEFCGAVGNSVPFSPCDFILQGPTHLLLSGF